MSSVLKFCVPSSQYDIRIILINKKNSVCASRKGSNIPTEKELADGYLFCDSGPYKEPDVTIILGTEEGGSHASILLLRFHKFDPDLTSTKKRQLFKDVWDSLSLNKFECRRSGGSSGFITDNSENVILKFMNQPGSSPRNGKGAVWIRGKDTWYIYYMGTYDGGIKRCKYTNPVPGGSFHLGHNFLEKHPFLAKFISTKPIAAIIISTIQERLLKKDSFNYVITPEAVSEELRNIAETNAVIAAHRSRSCDVPIGLKPVPKDLTTDDLYTLFYAIYNWFFIKYTAVYHAVGLHRDKFKNDTGSLENKVCFKLKQAQVPQRMLKNTHSYGRGGGGSDEFVFALLDWSCGQRSRRRVWTDTANAALPNAPTNANQALSQEIWDAFWQPNTVFVPQGINVDNLPYEVNEE